MFIDTHIHMTHKSFDGEVPCISSLKSGSELERLSRDELIKEIVQHGAQCLIEPAIDIESNARVLQLADVYPGIVLPAVGIHPARTHEMAWADRRIIEKYSESDNVIAVGEIGLDYYREQKTLLRLKQILWFIWQINLADKKNLPLILHIRKADKEAIKILRLLKSKLHGGVCHCFYYGAGTSRIFTEELGFALGIGGALLHKENMELEQAVKETPIEYLLLETDGPYVKPEKPEGITAKKWQKARNTSLIIPDIAARIAGIKGIPVSEVERITTENAKRIFRIE